MNTACHYEVYEKVGMERKWEGEKGRRWDGERVGR